MLIKCTTKEEYRGEERRVVDMEASPPNQDGEPKVLKSGDEDNIKVES